MQENLSRRANAFVDQIAKWAAGGESAPARVIGEEQPFREWTHYPQPDAIDKRSGWRFYYHAHPRIQRLAREHGHFHIFTPGPKNSERAPERRFSHLIGLSVDPKGLPLRLFTANRWVTDEIWQPAEAMAAWLERPSLRNAEPHDVGVWLENLVVLYRVEIAALLRARDLRVNEPGGGGEKNPRLDDRRLRYPSQLRISLAKKIRALEPRPMQSAA
ncbi:DUF6969 family protein [Rhodoblastus sp.]|uniref:DUF6969 family protein n=1 Tax=Rhodoblastus sp. TaxID=1962975 RepID=UPI003F9B383A